MDPGVIAAIIAAMTAAVPARDDERAAAAPDGDDPLPRAAQTAPVVQTTPGAAVAETPAGGRADRPTTEFQIPGEREPDRAAQSDAAPAPARPAGRAGIVPSLLGSLRLRQGREPAAAARADTPESEDEPMLDAAEKTPARRRARSAAGGARIPRAVRSPAATVTSAPGGVFAGSGAGSGSRGGGAHAAARQAAAGRRAAARRRADRPARGAVRLRGLRRRRPGVELADRGSIRRSGAEHAGRRGRRARRRGRRAPTRSSSPRRATAPAPAPAAGARPPPRARQRRRPRRGTLRRRPARVRRRRRPRPLLSPRPAPAARGGQPRRRLAQGRRRQRRHRRRADPARRGHLDRSGPRARARARDGPVELRRGRCGGARARDPARRRRAVQRVPVASRQPRQGARRPRHGARRRGRRAARGAVSLRRRRSGLPIARRPRRAPDELPRAGPQPPALAARSDAHGRHEGRPHGTRRRRRGRRASHGAPLHRR